MCSRGQVLSSGFRSGLHHWYLGLRSAICMLWHLKCPMALPLAVSARQAARHEDRGSSPVQQGLGSDSPCLLSDGHWLHAGVDRALKSVLLPCRLAAQDALDEATEPIGIPSFVQAAEPDKYLHIWFATVYVVSAESKAVRMNSTWLSPVQTLLCIHSNHAEWLQSVKACSGSSSGALHGPACFFQA